ncbi:MAG: tetratricopeptide repeat protein [candidate division Zixibacteria bacterium]|nr:tetratricopeptide repeat protein [candidate division Zixibacteria bacterium]NIR67335.1 tetratricopeptide repeat protein [candidate division Zixibacteria bacterium]NIS16212.1 tetratricopeptide repeat protein [candidate division Zixibacteria bacterium]NIS48711.1 tetratricopeptide repeat protein [candidate division Zixibacteria bacterium]NIT52604.1 tetratricopeptide repeat protein [candidate division Zixibacteria bacterium]
MRKLSLLKGKSDSEIEVLEKYLPESFARLADLYHARGEYKRALEILNQHAENFPDYPTGFWMLGKVYYRLKEKEKALKYLHRTLQIIPEHLAALELIGKIYMESGEQALARSYLRQVSQADQLGEMVFKNGNDEASARIEREQMDDVKERARGKFATETMINLYIKQGHKKLARELCEEILVMQPENTRIKSILKELES